MNAQRDSLENSIRALIEQLKQDGVPAEVSVLVADFGRPLISIDTDTLMEAGGLAQLLLAIYAKCNIGALPKDLLLATVHKKPGTGIISGFAAGTEISLEWVLRALLIEGDITAANMLLAAIGGHGGGAQTKVARWLQKKCLLTNPGMTRREDNLFESDVVSARDVHDAMQHILDRDAAWFAEMLAANHFLGGIRVGEWASKLDRLRPQLALQFGAWLAKRGITPEKVLDIALGRTQSKQYHLKEGILLPETVDGWRYIHQAGKIQLPRRRSPVTVVIMSRVDCRSVDPKEVERRIRAQDSTLQGIGLFLNQLM